MISLRSLIGLGIYTAMAVGLGVGLMQLRVEIAFLGLPSLEEAQSLPLDHLEREAQGAARLAESPMARAALAIRAANLFEVLAARAASTERRRVAMCGQLSALGRSIERRPLNARLLVSWANVRQALGGALCSEPRTQGEFSPVVEFALRQNQVSPQVLYSGGLLYLYNSEREKAWPMFRRMLSLSQDVSDTQRNFLISQLLAREEVLDLIPAKFPQVAEWSLAIKRLRLDLFRESSAELADLQRRAIERDVQQFQAGEIPGELHRERLISLMSAIASDGVRRRLDRALVGYFRSEGAISLADYLAERADARAVPYVASSLTLDTRPLKGSFVRWGSNDSVAFDHVHQSIGFFVPSGVRPKLIEVVARDVAPDLSPSKIKLFVSNDNVTWEEVYQGSKPTLFKLHRSTVVALTVDLPRYRYWKVHFDSAERRASFVNNLDSMVRVYGQ